MQQLLIKSWNVYFLPYAFRSPLPPPNRFVCLPQRVQSLLSLWPSLAFAASSFVSISLFPLPHFQFPPLLSINLFCFPSHWSPDPIPTILFPFPLGAIAFGCLFAPFSVGLKRNYSLYLFNTYLAPMCPVCPARILNLPICAMLLLRQPVSTVTDKGQTQYICQKCLTWSKQAACIETIQIPKYKYV